jgi:hypothetical protein
VTRPQPLRFRLRSTWRQAETLFPEHRANIIHRLVSAVGTVICMKCGDFGAYGEVKDAVTDELLGIEFK